MSIPIPHDTKEVLTFEHTKLTTLLGAPERVPTLKVMVTRRQGRVESITIQRIGDGYRLDAIVDVSGEELDFLVSIFAFFSEPGGSNSAAPMV